MSTGVMLVSLNCIKRLVFVIQANFAFCEVETELLSIVCTNLVLQRVKWGISCFLNTFLPAQTWGLAVTQLAAVRRSSGGACLASAQDAVSGQLQVSARIVGEARKLYRI
jgi:hypothetical protein